MLSNTSPQKGTLIGRTWNRLAKTASWLATSEEHAAVRCRGYILCAATIATIPLKAHATALDDTATNAKTYIFGALKVLAYIAFAMAGAPILMGTAGDHKGRIVVCTVGGFIALKAQDIVDTIWP